MSLELINTPPLKDVQAIHERYMRELALDEDQDGETIAALLEMMVEENSGNWKERAEVLLEETLKILKEKSLQAAMFFLGDRINERDKEKREASAGKPEVLARQLQLKALLQSAARETWNPETRALAGSFSQEAVPAWYYEWREEA